ncbi:MAG TPA: hypothetical protein VK956_04720, partial [Verrucomicrobium sp.]|nr:hypothetical protein [Verrucomicrobium sp.]
MPESDSDSEFVTTDPKGAAPALEGSAYSRVLREEQVKNASSFHWYRLAGVTGFLVLEAWQSGVHWTDQGGPSTFAILLAYWVVILLVQAVSLRWSALGRLGSLVVPFLDMPVVFLCQWHNLSTTPTDPRIVGNFTIGIFICLIMLAASSLERWQIYLAGVMAALLQLTLHRVAGEGIFGTVGGLVLISVA